MPEPGKSLYYPVWVSTHSAKALRFGPPCDTPGQAFQLGRAEVRAGNASVSFVVAFSGGEKTPLAKFTYPGSAKAVVLHWEQLWDVTE